LHHRLRDQTLFTGAFEGANRQVQARAFEADDLQVVDNVLVDGGMQAATRRGLLTRVAVGAAAVGVAGVLSPVEAFAAGDSIKTVGTTAVTAEALAVTFLSQVADRAAGSAVADAAAVVNAHSAFVRIIPAAERPGEGG
jgi:hypothetical protein